MMRIQTNYLLAISKLVLLKVNAILLIKIPSDKLIHSVLCRDLAVTSNIIMKFVSRECRTNGHIKSHYHFLVNERSL